MYVDDKLLNQVLTAAMAGATYTSAANVKTLIKKVTLNNPTAGALVVNIQCTPSGGSALEYYEKTLSATELTDVPELVNHILQPGDALAATGAAVNIWVSGIKMPKEGP